VFCAACAWLAWSSITYAASRNAVHVSLLGDGGRRRRVADDAAAVRAGATARAIRAQRGGPV
jgi:hypothetical protein